MSNTTSPMVATKNCKQCQQDLPLTAFGTKQARCKQCIRDLRAGKVKLINPNPEAAMTTQPTTEPNVADTPWTQGMLDAGIEEHIETPVDDTPADNEPDVDRPKKVLAMNKEELEAYTIDRANRLQKQCTVMGHGTITGPNLSRAYARRGNIQCRQCINDADRERKAARKAQA